MARRALALRAAPSRLQEPAGSAHLPAGSPRPARPDPWVVMAGHDRRPIGAPATAVQAELIRRSCGTLGSLSGARERAVRQSDHRTGLVNPRDSCGSPGSRSPPSATPTPASQEPHRRAARPHARSQPPALAALTDARRARASRPLHACRPPGSARTQKPRNARAGAAATRGSGPEEIKQLTRGLFRPLLWEEVAAVEGTTAQVRGAAAPNLRNVVVCADPVVAPEELAFRRIP